MMNATGPKTRNKYRIRTCFKTGFNGWVVFADTKKEAIKKANSDNSPCFDVKIYKIKNNELIYHKKATAGWLQ